MPHASEMGGNPVRGVNADNDRRVGWATVGIGGTGAVDATNASHKLMPGMSISRSSAGTYAVTGLPTCKRGSTLRAWPLVSAAGTVTGVRCTAFDPTAGTATLISHPATAATATDPASGDILAIELVALA